MKFNQKEKKGKKKEKRERYIVMYKILKSIIFKVVIIVKRDRKKERKNPLIPIISIILSYYIMWNAIKVMQDYHISITYFFFFKY